MTSLTDDFNDGIPGDNVATRPGWSEYVGTRRVIIGASGGIAGDVGGAGSGPGGVFFDTGSADHAVEITLKTVSINHICAVVRFVDAENYVAIMSRGTASAGLRLVKVVANTITDLDTMQPVADDRLRLEAVTNGASTDYAVYVNGSASAEMSGSVSNAEIDGNNTRAGIVNRIQGYNAADNLWDDFYGESLVSVALTLDPSGVASGEGLGTPALQPGAVTLTPAALAGQEALGTALLTPGPVVLAPSGLDNPEGLGSALLQSGALEMAPAGASSGESLGAGQLLPGAVVITPAGLDNPDAIGHSQLLPGAVVLAPTSLASTEALGGALLAAGAVEINTGGISSAETLGNPALANLLNLLAPAGLQSNEALGSAALLGGTDLRGWLVADVQLLPALLANLQTGPALSGETAVNGGERVH